MEVLVKVGKMPGEIREYGIQEGTSVREALNIAGLDPSGYEVKVDTVPCANIDAKKVTSTTKLILLVAKVKGNEGNI